MWWSQQIIPFHLLWNAFEILICCDWIQSKRTNEREWGSRVYAIFHPFELIKIIIIIRRRFLIVVGAAAGDGAV